MAFLGRNRRPGIVTSTAFKPGHVQQKKETLAVEAHDQTVSAVSDKPDGYNTQIAVVEQEIASLAVAATLDEPEAVARVTELGEQLKSLYKSRDLAATALTAAERAELDRRNRKQEADDAASRKAFGQHVGRYEKHLTRALDLAAEMQSAFEQACNAAASAFAMLSPVQRTAIGRLLLEDQSRSLLTTEFARCGDNKPYAVVPRSQPTRITEYETRENNFAAPPMAEIVAQQCENLKSSFSPSQKPAPTSLGVGRAAPASVVRLSTAPAIPLSSGVADAPGTREPGAGVVPIDAPAGHPGIIDMTSRARRAVIASNTDVALVAPPEKPQRPAVPRALQDEWERIAETSSV